MTYTARKPGRSVIPWSLVWSLVWAAAIIAAAFLFKGNAASFWIESGLIVGALGCVVLRPQRLTCFR